MINLSTNKWANKDMKDKIIFHIEALTEDVIIDDVISFCSDKHIGINQSEEETSDADVPAALSQNSNLFKFKSVSHSLMQIFKGSL